MEFRFNLSDIFSSEINRIGRDMLPVGGLPRDSPFHQMNLSLAQGRVMELIDAMGRASAVAQQLRAPITSAQKMRSMQDEHVVYLMVDLAANAVVGLLKVGHKNLFLLDKSGAQNEVYPMCVLDFYVHESRQRSGCGRRVFEQMMQEQRTHPKHMAVDRPSPKLLGFLRKHYELSATIQQVNNYVIFEGFFNNNQLKNECSPAGAKKARIYMGKLQYV